MAKDSTFKLFPEINNKSGVTSKKSLFERQKAEAEAKRQREQEETAAVYEDFVKSFDDEGGESAPPTIPSRGGFGTGGISQRHFTKPGARGGLGSLKSSGPGSLGPPPPSLARKRQSDVHEPSKREGLFAFDDDNNGYVDPKKVLQTSDDEDARDEPAAQERHVPKPTLRLSSLPPGTSPAAIKAIIPSSLAVEGVRVIPPTGPGSKGTERRSMNAIVTLAQDTPASDIDTVVNALQNHYMGRGFYLSLSRHLSSTAVAIEAPSTSLRASISSLPFGARPIIPSSIGLGRGAGSTAHRGGFAPPSSFAPQAHTGPGAPQVQVTVTPPSDLKQIRIIHKTLEALIKYGPDFEALLMTRKDVQLEEKWAWIWDSRSVGGVYYRWRLWDLLSGAYRRRGRVAASTTHNIFQNGASWLPPEQKLPFEYTTKLDEFVSDSDYHSSEDEDSGDEARRRYTQHHRGAPPPDGQIQDPTDTQAYLNPLQKAKLTHLLARLPESNAKLRRGDVARVTAFAIQHAGEGAEEVVQMIVRNVTIPFSCSGANPDHQREQEGANDDERPNGAGSDEEGAQPGGESKEMEDTSAARLVALYVVSDILSSSSTSGVRHAWRYRSFFENQLKLQQTFEHLGRLEKGMNWGRLRGEKWKRSVHNILALWEGWCVFPQQSQEAFKSAFNDPPMTKEEIAEKVEEEEAGKKTEQMKKKWKSVEERNGEIAEPQHAEIAEHGEELQMERVASDEDEVMAIDGADGEPLDSDLDGTPITIEEELGRKCNLRAGKYDGTPLQRKPKANGTTEEPIGTAATTAGDAASDKRAALAASIAARLGKTTPVQASSAPPEANAPAGTVRKRQRPRAEDMFASDEE